jgi:hypothetical protein
MLGPLWGKIPDTRVILTGIEPGQAHSTPGVAAIALEACSPSFFTSNKKHRSISLARAKHDPRCTLPAAGPIFFLFFSSFSKDSLKYFSDEKISEN